MFIFLILGVFLAAKRWEARCDCSKFYLFCFFVMGEIPQNCIAFYYVSDLSVITQSKHT